MDREAKGLNTGRDIGKACRKKRDPNRFDFPAKRHSHQRGGIKKERGGEEVRRVKYPTITNRGL